MDIWEASKLGDLARIRAILAADPSAGVAWHDIHKCTPIFLAAAYNQADAVRLLAQMSRIDVNTPADNGRVTPLHAAARAGHLEALQALLEAGADPLVPQRNGETAADVARKGGFLQAVKLLQEWTPRKR